MELFVPDLHGVTDTSSNLKRRRAARQAPAAGLDVQFCSRNAPDRPELEAFIGAGFRRQHGATVRSFMPVLVGLRDAAGTLVGAAGYRNGAEETLYLEQYLAQPVEMGIARRHGLTAVTRADVAEIGNFVCRDCPTAMAMVGVLAEFLLDQEHDWVVFTATRTVRGIMRHLGLRLAELGRAEHARVAVTSDQWGAYYEHDPRVMLGYVPSWRGADDRTWSI
jgi:hypothetical protein